MGVHIMKCKCGNEIKPCGFPRYNQRFECDCGKIMIPASSEKLSDKIIRNTWTTREEFYPDWLLNKEGKDE
jgi:hypothetical protein